MNLEGAFLIQSTTVSLFFSWLILSGNTLTDTPEVYFHNLQGAFLHNLSLQMILDSILEIVNDVS